MNTNRRTLLTTTIPAFAVVLAGCAGTSAAAIEAQIVADVQGLVPETQAIFAAVTQYAPNAISASVQGQVTTLEAAAVAGAKSVAGATVQAGTTALQNVESFLTVALQAIGAALPIASVALPVLAPFVPMYDAAIALLPGIEAYINSLVHPVVTAASVAAPMKAVGAVFTPAQARAVLNIPTKS